MRAADTAGASEATPKQLRVIGEVAAGYIYRDEVGPGEAVRIMTGAPVPRGADSIVPFEETDEPPGRAFGAFAKGRDAVGVLKAANVAANIRRAGEDVEEGSEVMSAGTELRAAQGRRAGLPSAWRLCPSTAGRSWPSSRRATSCSRSVSPTRRAHLRQQRLERRGAGRGGGRPAAAPSASPATRSRT